VESIVSIANSTFAAVTSAAAMTAEDVADLIALLEHHGLEVYVDGGWAVDAVLGKQTRPHDDLDIALPHAQVPRLRALLDARGFHEQRRDDSWECNFVLAWLVKFHTGYELDHKDWHDVRRLCERFQIAIPDEYLKFRE
jgi:lincosamide nucleotidyltransferase A/C/D/E